MADIGLTDVIEHWLTSGVHAEELVGWGIERDELLACDGHALHRLEE